MPNNNNDSDSDSDSDNDNDNDNDSHDNDDHDNDDLFNVDNVGGGRPFLRAKGSCIKRSQCKGVISAINRQENKPKAI